MNSSNTPIFWISWCPEFVVLSIHQFIEKVDWVDFPNLLIRWLEFVDSWIRQFSDFFDFFKSLIPRKHRFPELVDFHIILPLSSQKNIKPIKSQQKNAMRSFTVLKPRRNLHQLNLSLVKKNFETSKRNFEIQKDWLKN